MTNSQRVYLLLASGLLALEILIALFVRDWLIRPYGGDFLAVILLYCLIRVGGIRSVGQAALLALGIAYLIEIMQSINLLDKLHLTQLQLARVLVGSHFDWGDLLAYALGIALVLAVERGRHRATWALGQRQPRS